MFDSATSTSPSGSTPTARAAASAASAFTRMCLEAKGSVSVSGSVSTSPPGPNVTVVTSSRRWRSSSGSSAGRTAVPPGFSAAISSAFAAAMFSMLPSSSRWTGPMLTMTPTSGSAISASSAIWPSPRIAISSTRTSVPGGAPRIVSGRAISVFRFWAVATTRRCVASIPASRSFVEVLPVEPVMPTTCACRWRRQAVARRPSARSGSSAARSAPGCAHRAASACSGPTRTPHAPLASACGANRPPSTFSPVRPTKRSPWPTPRESMTTRCGPAACGAGLTSRAPAAWATRSGDQSRTERLAGDGDVVEGDLAPAGELLALLVALARDDEHVTGPGHVDRLLDRRAAVDLHLDPAAGSLEDLADDGLRRLVAGVVGGDDRDVGALTGDRAHERALGAVAVAAGAEDHDEAVLRERAGGAQDVVERVGRVGVVDEDRERLALVDGLEAAGDLGGVREGVGDRVVGDAQGPDGGDGAQDVEDVEAARERRAAGGAVEREGRAGRVALDRRRPEPRVGGVDADRDGVVQVAREPPAVGVVDVDHGGLRAGLEQAALGREVVLHRRMEVEVVLREVREDRDVPVDRVGAVELEGVARDLHDDGLVADVAHLGEGALQVDGLGRGADHRPFLAADDGGDRADEARAAPRRLEQPAGEEGGRRLAVGAGDADGLERSRGIPVEPRGGGRHRGADVGHPDLGHVSEVERPLHDERDRPALDRVGREVVAVTGEPGHAEEERPGRDEPVVVGERRHLDRGPVARGIAENLAKLHRADESTAQGGGSRDRDRPDAAARRCRVAHCRPARPCRAPRRQLPHFGGIRRYGSANDAICPNAGAATVPP